MVGVLGTSQLHPLHHWYHKSGCLLSCPDPPSRHQTLNSSKTSSTRRGHLVCAHHRPIRKTSNKD
ncbi:hypothetical protein BDB00DRAFT_49891 [Zychaea mexicana]|uniref:uncharacterized protein n=1 Tax=Zychaea mexicana TaxID=64656 RepID=UPI0022FE43C2|nr:uncharacterized protein BDB00DRAFT_49891 [Zychaea mexicana]KAI9497017.1 hypothetical protein BDB00DRAFT_49891 [Zychaea mexicana]